ncbi:D-Ala-D-Ala carboxypeptidase family metallohydrolase [Methanohalobium sp.]|uniref:D-Ala-D-Ala carboxypeptidase family metallohydrolase n=1 Tax=Methanohalobium sp. TaxID=2837493 RepID=UPI0025E9470C|nr:D-Ala-D-Ala carboxypeptidase family metallohydrolase [Methanohalobium sp.]
MKLSENFTLSEFTKSQTAERKGIDNNPSEVEIHAMKEVAQNVLQPARDHFGPIIVTSGYRSPELNKAIGGSSTSQHRFGEAADIESIRVSNLKLAEWIRDNLEFDQLILEFVTPGDPTSGWVHVSYKSDGDNRKEVLTAKKVSGSVQYVYGLEI